MAQAINIFEAAAAYRSAHNRALSTGAYTRNYDNENYYGVRKACADARRHFEWGMTYIKTAAMNPAYVKRMGW